MIEKTPFKLISAGVRKDQLGPEYRRAYSLYDIVLGLTLERLQSFLETKECSQNETPIVFESRGRKEDRILQNEFDALVNNSGLARTGSLFRLENCKFSFLCCDKSAAMTGLQIADLCAYPIGRYVFDSGTKYLPFQQISNRLIGFGTSDQSDGLRIFPFK